VSAGAAAHVRRWLLACTAVLVFLVLAATTYQGVTTALERRKFPRPGRMVNAGTHQLHIYCEGHGTPTVVLEAAAAGMSASWGSLQPELAMATRVCSYDRSGLGWSEWGDRGYAAERVPQELRTLLDHAGEPAPFILVGAGLGASYARLFAAAFPADTAAIVLVDTTAGPRATQATPWLARIGALRLTHTFERQADGLPPFSRGAMRAFLNRPDHLARAAQESAQAGRAGALAAAAPIDPRVAVYGVDYAGVRPSTFVSRPAEARPAIDTVLRAIADVRAAAH
jgi:pimeloyl-ACP methyl ester carboxylesterase